MLQLRRNGDNRPPHKPRNGVKVTNETAKCVNWQFSRPLEDAILDRSRDRTIPSTRIGQRPDEAKHPSRSQLCEGGVDRDEVTRGAVDLWPEDWLDLKVAYLWGGEEDQDQVDVEVGLQR